jgi:phage regulator Rha-like protein
MVNGFEIAEYQDEEHKKIADAINQITKGTD